MYRKIMKKEIAFGVLLAIGVLAFSVYGGGIELPSASPGDIALKVDKAGDTMTGALTVGLAGTPLLLTNTTDAVSNTLCEIYSNRGTGIDGDEIRIPFFFDDDGSTKANAGTFVIVGDDLDGKGGVHASFIWEAGSSTPVDVFKCDGVNNRVEATKYVIAGATGTGFSGGADILNLQTDGLTRVQVSDGSQHVQTVGYDLVADRDLTADERLLVGGRIGAIDGSAVGQFDSTTKGFLPPRMTTTQRDAITLPATGLEVFDTTLNMSVENVGTPASPVWAGTGGGGPTIKSGAESDASFSGNPRVATITFGTAFSDANYSVSVINTDARTWTIDSQVAASFVINTNASQALTAAVSWTAIAHFDP